MLLHQKFHFGKSVQMDGRKYVGVLVAERMYTTGKRMKRS